MVDECDTDFLIMASDDDLCAPNFLEEIDKLTFKYPLVDMYCTRVKRTNRLLVWSVCTTPFEVHRQLCL